MKPGVLIVEDEGIVAEDLQETLADFGYDAFAIAASSDEAIRAATARCPDLVLMDIRIQGARDGIDTARIMHEQFRVPVVYLTAHADEATIERAKLTQPSGYLMKPLRPGELRGTIETALYRTAMAKRLAETERSTHAAERLASLGTLAAGIAHEINNPLSVVVSNAAIAQSDLDDLRAELVELVVLPTQIRNRFVEVEQTLSDVGAAGGRIRRVIADLQAFSRPAQVPIGRADVVAALQWALRAADGEIRPRAHVVTTFGDVPFVQGEESRLGQVFVQLLANAAHAIPPGAPAAHEIAVSVQATDAATVVIEIRDSGTGIPDAIRGRVFEPFFTTKRTGGGTGLGLSICHGILSSLGGSIELVAAPSGGTIARVTLREAAVPPEERQPTPAPRRARILAIDDEPMMLRTLTRMLRDHDVVAVSRATEALAMIAKGDHFDIVISDLMMPEMTGIEFYEALLENNPALANSIIFITGGSTTARSDAFLRSVSNERFEKPFVAAELVALIARRLST